MERERERSIISLDISRVRNIFIFYNSRMRILIRNYNGVFDLHILKDSIFIYLNIYMNNSDIRSEKSMPRFVLLSSIFFQI